VSALGALLDSLPRTTLVVGKGGVGKTTCAVGLATLFARRGERTLLMSTDPAAALTEVIGAPVSTNASPVAGEPLLDARQLSAAELRREFLERWRDTIAEIIDRGTYLDRDDVDGIVDATLPGVDEIFALLALADVLADNTGQYARIVVDTAPTGHTLRLLAMPETFRALLSMLDLMQDKHRFMVRALTHRYRRDRADEFLDEMRRRIDGLRAALSDARSVAAVVITRDEPVVEAETRRYVESLEALRMRVAAVIGLGMRDGDGDGGLRGRMKDGGLGMGGFRDVLDSSRADSASRFDGRCENARGHRTRRRAASRVITGESPNRPARAITGESPNRPARAITGESPNRPPRVILRREAPKGSLSIQGSSNSLGAKAILSLASLAQDDTQGPAQDGLPLTIVAGKGGVGKSTVACALGIAAADEFDGLTLLVSTDPAPSIADALGAVNAPWAESDVEFALDDPPRLVVRQMDATAAFARVRDQYSTRIDALFDALVGRGVDVERDRAILRDLFRLAPPGIDEVYALSILGDALHEQRFARIIIDPAPTGHLLRLLEMPAIALDWSHRLMRLMLKYRDVVGLGDTARELLDFAKRTRALDALLHDRERCGVIVVTLDEPVVRAETARLCAAVRARGIAVTGVPLESRAICSFPSSCRRFRSTVLRRGGNSSAHRCAGAPGVVDILA
jgi:arsenite-transporting ATPase